ncbi:hypothetical protein O181_023841 [Austropuccinia psidii MF-1]|uniref:Uncharacterized protein n=1 Tax=Austropuccinia psidii MF-1 TaxID=1389203 RepID=A0A9Q3CFH9_9BASI|nr:hypothetical protein [Austropuccinia psidii MF-1]
MTARLNTALKGNASIWYTGMKEIHGRRNRQWWNSKIIQKCSNGTWIWQKTMSFKNDKYSVEKDPYEWFPRQYKRVKAIDAKVKIQIRNYKLLKQMPGEPEHAKKFRCNQSCTLDDIENTLQDVRKRTKIGKYSQYKSSIFTEKQPFGVYFKDKPKERVAEVTKKKNPCHNCWTTDHYVNNFPKAKKESMPLNKSQRKNPQQRILNKALCMMPSERNLTKTKIQGKSF